MKGNQIIIYAVVLILISAGTFYGGMKYQQGKTPQFIRSNMPHDIRQMGQRAGEGGANMIRGEIIKKDKTGFTIQMDDDSSKIVFVSDNTNINQATQGSMEDLEEGQEVVVFGQVNSDGSVTATQIQLNYEMMKNNRENN